MRVEIKNYSRVYYVVVEVSQFSVIFHFLHAIAIRLHLLFLYGNWLRFDN